MKRLDIYLVEQGYFDSRAKAQDNIKDNKVLVNGNLVNKAAFQLTAEDIVEVDCSDTLYVSRGAYKLKQALEDFKIDLREKVVLDIGASTGGFTEIALESGASLIYAVDVGSKQLHPRLHNEKRVVSLENTDARTLNRASFERKVDFVSIDVSFISVKLLLPIVYELLYDNNEAVVLVKPQFELPKRARNKQGVVREEKQRLAALRGVEETAAAVGFWVLGSIVSETVGRDGNIEYLLYLRK